MKKIISVICSAAIAMVSLTFSGASVIAEDEHRDNVLIAYFSRAGENYSVGVIEKRQYRTACRDRCRGNRR